MARLAFCGLGQMGAPMAARLLAAGHEVVVWNRSPARAEPLRARGAVVAASPAEAAREVELAFTMLSDAGALQSVVAGPEGLAAGLRAGATLIEMSTVGPDALETARGALRDGVRLVDSPVLGSVPQAESGTLRLFVGASPEDFERLKPILGALGTPQRVGGPGAGAALKLVVNSTLGALMTTLGEALALADGFGLEESVVLDALSDSPIGATTKRKRPNIESGEYPPSFKLELALKDMRLVLEAARRARVELRLAAAATEWWRRAAEAGLGPLDYSAVIAHLRGLPARGAADPEV